MSLEQTLAALAERRAAYQIFQAQVDEDLRNERARRLGDERAAIDHLVFKASAEGATMGQIKRAYNTKDHRTISDKIKAHTAEIDAIRKAAIQRVKDMPEWLEIHDSESFTVTIGEFKTGYSVTSMQDGTLMFGTGDPLWNDDYTIKNEAVDLLDGKTEADGEEAAIVGKFLRKYNQ